MPMNARSGIRSDHAVVVLSWPIGREGMAAAVSPAHKRVTSPSPDLPVGMVSSHLNSCSSHHCHLRGKH